MRIAQLCGTDADQMPELNVGSAVVLELSSDAANQGQGFVINYTIIHEGTRPKRGLFTIIL